VAAFALVFAGWMFRSAIHHSDRFTHRINLLSTLVCIIIGIILLLVGR
jgi:hypothetical protein